MTTARSKRLAKERAAAAFIEKHHGPMADLLVKVSGDLGEEWLDLPRAQADARLAAEMAYRLDRAISVPNELVEALDWLGFFLASLLVISLWRSLEQRTERRARRADVLKKRLVKSGKRMTKARRVAIERRITRLEKA